MTLSGSPVKCTYLQLSKRTHQNSKIKEINKFTKSNKFKETNSVHYGFIGNLIVQIPARHHL